MNAQLEFGRTENRSERMNGKPVFYVPAKSVLNLDSGFKHKLLCDGPTFSLGTACGFSCTFCYVGDMFRKLYATPMMAAPAASGKDHSDIVVRRDNGLEILRSQLTDRHGRPKYKAPGDRRVIYSSPAVDVAANTELMRESVEACKIILELTNWQVRLLSKSSLLPQLAEHLTLRSKGAKTRVIYGLSTGTLDDKLARSFEQGTAPVTKRIESLHWLQDNGFRTFGMICPSLPQVDYGKFARGAAAAIRAWKCEHVWGEVMNLRGESFTRTVDALRGAGYQEEADRLQVVSTNKKEWEVYAMATFEAYAGLPSSILPKGKLRFLQYVSAGTREWWTMQEGRGAICL